MRTLLKSVLLKTPLYPAAKEVYRHTLNRDFLRARMRLMDFYRGFVGPGRIVYDIGANRGDFSDAFLRLGATVYAVEPHPVCTAELKALYGHEARFTLVDCALGAAPGELPLYLGENGMDNVSTLSDDYRRDAMKVPGLAVAGWNRSVNVRVDTLDRLIEAHGLPDFCKIDVEGYEIEVLRGLHRPLPLLQFEYQPWSVEKAVECVAYLTTLGGYRFNITMSVGRDDEVRLEPEWVSPDAMNEILRGKVADTQSVGDVFARSV